MQGTLGSQSTFATEFSKIVINIVVKGGKKYNVVKWRSREMAPLGILNEVRSPHVRSYIFKRRPLRSLSTRGADLIVGSIKSMYHLFKVRADYSNMIQ